MFSRREFFKLGAGAGGKALETLLGPELPRAWPIIRVRTDEPYVCIGIDDGWDPEKVEQFLAIAEKWGRY